ncbi:MAG: DVUA0089 family protein [Candidatus Solibacter sp.]
MSTIFRFLGLALLTLGVSSSPAAATILYSNVGNFALDNDVLLVPFTVSDPSLVSFRTLSYGGGINANGAVIAKGGFEPLLQLFNLDGSVNGGSIFPGPGSDPCGPRTPDPDRANFCLDIFAQVALGPGDYLLALTQNDNVTAGSDLSGGFIYDGDPNFNNGFATLFFQGDSHWALDVTSDQVPEPASLWMTASALLLAGWRVRRRTN